jgi:hypothetical protein
MKSIRVMFAAPAACAALLIGMVAESSTRIQPADAEPYHSRAKMALESIPMQIGSWSGEVGEVPRQAVKLLHPNFIQEWKFSDNNTAAPHWRDRWASLLVDQCRDARDMNGHWPPNCYVNTGEELTYSEPRDWQVDGLVITGMEYHFLKTSATESTRTAVYNFLIVPGTGICRDMAAVRKAAEDYQRRYYGAAQFQLLMNADLPQQERDEIFTTLMQPCVPVIRTLMSGGIQ